jgi:hypothetical protein
MSPNDQNARVVFTEGSFELLAGYEDRSNNLLIPTNPQTQPTLSMARDWMKPDETLPQYFERQLARLKSQFASYKVLSQSDDALLASGAPPGGDAAAPSQPALPGLRVDATYRNAKQSIRKRQAVFEVAPRRVIIFTASSLSAGGGDFDRMWANWLASYRLPPADPPAPADDTVQAP